MARKKRKAVKSRPLTARSTPIAEAGGIPAWLLPVLGWLALVFSWLAALGGVADGTVDWRHIFDSDILRPYSVFRDAFLDEGYPASGWELSKAPYYFPTWAFQWPLFALGVDFRAALYIFPLLQVGFAAAGWILVCDFLFGKSPARRVFVLLLHAATFLHLAWRESHLFIHQMIDWHYGAWACVPWLLWLSFRTLDAGKKQIPSSGSIIALIGALTIATVSDSVVVPWFVAPAALAAALSSRPKMAAAFIAAMGVGVLLGRGIYHAVIFENPTSAGTFLNYDPQTFKHVFGLILGHLGTIASLDSLEFLVMLAFAAAVAWQLAVAFVEKKRSAQAFHPRLFLFLLIPVSAALPVVAVSVWGYTENSYQSHPVKALRYELPLILFPLFTGWALLPSPKWKFSARAGLAGCAVVVAISIPKLMRIDLSAMDPFGTPFQKCFAENAQNRGWTGGISNFHFTLPLHHNPDAGVANYAWAVVMRKSTPGESHIVAGSSLANWRRYSGDFQYVVVNVHKDRLLYRPPRTGDRGCPVSEPWSCMAPEGGDHVLQDREVRGAFGDPVEVVECAGVALYHYDPPIRLDFTGDRNRVVIGRKF